MKSLLYKEFKLAIPAFVYILPLLGVLLLIPNWPYFIALMYVFFITIPNIFGIGKSQNDTLFSVMLPIRKRDVVKVRVISLIAIELLHVLVAVIFGVVNMALYPKGSFLLDPNVAFFGFAFIMFAIYNVVFLPMFYKTAYKIAAAATAAFVAALVFVASIELLVLFVPAANKYLDGSAKMVNQLPILFAGIALFVLSAIVSYKVSAKRFEKVDV